MPSSPDFRLDGYDAVNDRVAEQFWQHIDIEATELTVLAEHHTDDQRHSYYVLHNGAVTWGIPGEPQLVALHLQRDVKARTFRFQHEQLPLVPMAQSWLIARGCPKDAIALRPDTGTDPADEATRVLEDRLTSDGDHFALVTSCTSDDDPDRMQITVLLAAIDENAPLRFRVLLEEVDTEHGTHTLREGGFATYEQATAWWQAHWSGDDVPLPTAQTATRRSAPSAMPGLPAPPVPRTGPTR
ncbi:hypothetical protein GCM10010211_20160 [Streptomyces albospinus]|uniref:Uncharacterized protein n=1 Tax=Streptomyces albospinus TaxID=285515 RepID=A0ABQ2UVD6_9ACTN|nr:hypothetical protein [Streptomyces albospinus]GGU55411.1 hypothetical protein GCM10010211_20160 [Streptomyces albospinus]